MTRPHLLSTLLIVTLVCSLVLPPAGAVHNNQGTIKVHDNEAESPPQRNVPHVACEFWVEGFDLGDDAGWIVFYAWPPTGDKSVVESGEGQDWTADPWSEEHGFHFLAGPFTLPEGHYRVEVYTDAGHPGSSREEGNPHFAKSKTFWVEPCVGYPVERPPCPPEVNAVAQVGMDDEPMNAIGWAAVDGADEYRVYRAVGGGDFELIGTTTQTSFDDTEVEAGVTYEYSVTSVDDGFESEACASLEVTAIPFFPSLAVGAIAVLGSLGAFVYLRRK